MDQEQLNSREELEEYIQKRVRSGKVYSQVTNNTYICSKSSPFEEELGKAYVKAYKDTTLESWINEPHLFKLINDIYLTMRRTSKDQCLTLFGNDSKIEHAFSISQYINLLCGQTNKTNKLTKRFSGAMSLITSMSTVLEDRRCSYNIQLQFNTNGKWTGAFIQEGPFDSARVTNFRKTLRNYDIFYALLAGINEADKVKWHLGDPSQFRITCGDYSAKDRYSYDLLQTSLDNIGFSADMKSMFWQIIAGLLHLSNINFIISDSTSHQKVTIVQNTHVLEITAGLFGVDPKSIEASLTVSTSLINGTTCTQLLNIKESEEQRDLLVRQCYTTLFSWLIEFANKKLNTSEFANSIWIIDPVLINNKDKTNDLYSFLSNTFYESSLSFFVNKGILDVLEYQIQQSQIIKIPFKYDNSTLDLLLNNDINISDLLNKESLKNSNFGSINQVIKLNCQDHSKFASGRSSSSFGISHFNSTVYYDCTLMSSDNTLPISTDLSSLFNGSAEFQSSTNGILVKLFSPKSLKSLSNTHINTLTKSTKIIKFASFLKSICARTANCKHWSLHHFTDPILLKSHFIYPIYKARNLLLDMVFSHQEYSSRYKHRDILIGYESPSFIFLNFHIFRNAEYQSRHETDLMKEETQSEMASAIDMSEVQSEMGDIDVFTNLSDEDTIAVNTKTRATKQNKIISSTRRNWQFLVKCVTCCIPSKCLSPIYDIQMAYREKLTLCFLILLISASMLFFIIGLGPLLCPIQKVYTLYELSTRRGLSDALVAMNGKIYTLQQVLSLTPNHSQRSYELIDEYGGKDISYSLYPFKKPEYYCSGIKIQKGLTLSIDPSKLDPNATQFASVHNIWPNPSKIDKFMTNTGTVVRQLAWDPSTFSALKSDSESPRALIVIGTNVYDLSGWVSHASDVNYQFLDLYVPGASALLSQNIGNVLNSAPNSNKFILAMEKSPQLRQCMNIFYAGIVDTRNSFQCQLSNYLLLSTSIFMCILILFKFLAALKSVGTNKPTGLSKHVIIQVPCYTESIQSIKKTINSIALLDYDDKLKLMVVICDGMVIGSGNDKPTGDLVMAILGITEDTVSEPLSFLSVGNGSKQHNMAKVYSGLYELEGHLLPYLLIIKVGTQMERVKPGNRGKRDSQMILMRYLNKCLYKTAMSPLELQLYHHMYHIIGVDPIAYDLVLMVDADTRVHEQSLSHLVSTMVNDTGIIGLCGETKLANENQSWSTMIQVYEYYISHHLAKAFESMFGSVTCLPGCFCMYRVHSLDNGGILCHVDIINKYGDNEVDTLHKKNLLSLGEDRYLTTVIKD